MSQAWRAPPRKYSLPSRSQLRSVLEKYPSLVRSCPISPQSSTWYKTSLIFLLVLVCSWPWATPVFVQCTLEFAFKNARHHTEILFTKTKVETSYMIIIAGSFNGWKRPFPMRRIAGSDDLVRSVLLPPGPTEFKFVTDGEWRYSPRDPVSSDKSSGTVNNCKRVQVNSSLSWRGTSTDHTIFVTGSFLAWSELVPLSYTSGGIYKAHCCLPVCCGNTCACGVVKLMCSEFILLCNRDQLQAVCYYHEGLLSSADICRMASTMFGFLLMAHGRCQQTCLQPRTGMAFPATSSASTHVRTLPCTTEPAGSPVLCSTVYWTAMVGLLLRCALVMHQTRCTSVAVYCGSPFFLPM